MLLNKLIENMEVKETRGSLNIDIKDIFYNSKEVKENSMFVCLKGSSLDGHLFAADAGSKGAIAFVSEKDIDVGDKTIIKVLDTRKALAYLANRFFEEPSRKLKVIGVTGTNGKTTTTYLVESIFNADKKKIGVIGTIEYRIGDSRFKSINTTPESLDLAKFFNKLIELKSDAVCMEVSSHALEMHRVDYCDFDVASFTNVTHDHLDFHGSFDNYLSAKIKLFRNLKKEAYAIVNLDDPNVIHFIENTNAKIIGYTTIKNELGKHFNNKNKFSFILAADSIESTIKGVSFNVNKHSENININLKLVGLYNVSNALAAVGCGLASGISFETIKKGLESVACVPGRFEKVNINDNNGYCNVIIDYAHTPDALNRLLLSARSLAKNRIITVFGCGGDRDRTKRPAMGEIANRLADVIVVTSDNPRTEEPEDIMAEIKSGIKGSKECYFISDRKEAIKKAILELARKDDVVLIAGKGHEDYQILKDKTIHFSDREVASEFLMNKK